MKQVVLTGDRPTGKLHLGHYIGSLKRRLELQKNDSYRSFVMIADMQALTDNAHDPDKIRRSLVEVALDYLSVGLDPAITTIFVQSQIPALSELTMYYMNLVSISRVERNPTVKTEIKQKTFSGGVPAGFVVYPISQAADITAFKAKFVPVGVDQLPMIEQAREIVRSFNATYQTDCLVEPEAIIPKDDLSGRLPGTDGNAKMSKSLGNGIYLSDDQDTVKRKVMSMYTDPGHIHVDDPGKVEGNTVFQYLDVFGEDKRHIAELKERYQAGGLGDVTVKQYLFEVLDELLSPIRQRRRELAGDLPAVYRVLLEGSGRANAVAEQTLAEVRQAIGVNYFDAG
ncbi:MAG: tryptophan--tRNA ligase [Candidatus Nanoperiomorbus sp.]